MKNKVMFSFFVYVLFASRMYAQLASAGLDPSKRPITHLEKAEQEGWTEEVGKRGLNTVTYSTPNGKKIVYSSIEPVCYSDEKGNLIPIDIRFTQQKSEWVSFNRFDPIRVTRSGEANIFNARQNFSIHFSKTLGINANTSLKYTEVETTQNSHLVFKNILPGIDKTFDFKPAGLKYSYVLNHPSTVSGTWFTVTEEIVIPEGCEIKGIVGEGENKEGMWAGALGIYTVNTNELKSKILPLVCYDQNNSVTQGMYKVSKGSKKGQYKLTLLVSSSWLNDSERKYPVTVDPLVTGPTALFTGGTRPSCFFPSYNVDSILVTVPAGISVTNLSVTCSFYANPFTTTVMADGRMYFSTTCAQSTVFQVLPPAGSSPGTAYLDNYDLHSPLMCCYPQGCAAYTFWLKYHLSRTSNGTLCNTTYLYYDPLGTSWPFSAYVEGYTPEAYGPTMNFVPTSVCANTCQVDARIFARYGVPPYTFTHPWSADTVVAGVASGCGTGNQVKMLTLDIPLCPNYCDTATTITVPAPVVYDACGVVLTGFDTVYTLPVKPVATANFSVDTVEMCSGNSFSVNYNSCLSGSLLAWEGNANVGTTLVSDTLLNSGNAVTATTYIGSVTVNGCTGIGDTLVVLTYPYADDSFVVSTPPYIINQDVQFTNTTSLNGNTVLTESWNFGDSTVATLTNVSHAYSDTGMYTICHYTQTILGCNDTSCYTIEVIDIELLLPNIITPNGDGINDVLYIKAIEYYPENKVSVFNRWGTKIFEKQNYQNDWKATNVSDGAYYYVLEAPGIEPRKSILHINKKK